MEQNKIMFHTGSTDKIVGEFVIIDANQTETKIINDTIQALNNACVICDCGSTLGATDIFSHSELSFTAARVWCFENGVTIKVINWVNGHAKISTIDKDGRVDNWDSLFEKRNELLMKLM